MPNEGGFLYELRRRHVVRVAVAYAVAAWVLLQLASIVFPTFGAPDWVLKAFIALLALGFPLALVLAWAYELTADGIRRTEPAHSPEARPPEHHARVGRSLNAVVIGVLAVAVFALLWRQFGNRAPTGEPGAQIIATAHGKSIAVLPFESLSEDKANGYFASGMQDEILTRLAGIHALKVISRTSTEQYASHPPNLKIVAEQLGVSAVLEGSVQKAGELAHINVQLIDTQSDSHLWAESYDRELKDVFAVERDIAEKVADALKAQLLPEEVVQVAAVPTQDPEAHDLYWRGLTNYNHSNDQYSLTPVLMPQAIELFQKAVAKDPKFALAIASLAKAQMYMYFFGPDRTAARLDAARAAAEQALALNPKLGDGHEALALYWYWGHRDYAQALRELDIARSAKPNDTQIEVLSAAIARRQGKWEEALAGFQRAAKIDPRNANPQFEVGQTTAYLRRYEAADQAFMRATELTADPAIESVRRGVNMVDWKGDLGPLRAAIAALQPGTSGYEANAIWRWHLHWWSRDYLAAAHEMEATPDRNWSDLSNFVAPSQLFIGWAYAAAGDSAKARSVFGQLREKMQIALRERPDDQNLHVILAFALAGVGEKDAALAEGHRAVDLLPVSRDALNGPVYPTLLARLCAQLGDKDQAIDLIKQMLAVPAGTLMSPARLRIDPAWDPLRDDPRFQKLIADDAGASRP